MNPLEQAQQRLAAAQQAVSAETIRIDRRKAALLAEQQTIDKQLATASDVDAIVTMQARRAAIEIALKNVRQSLEPLQSERQVAQGNLNAAQEAIRAAGVDIEQARALHQRRQATLSEAYNQQAEAIIRLANCESAIDRAQQGCVSSEEAVGFAEQRFVRLGGVP